MLPYSAYLVKCRKTVEDAAEYDSDRFLSILVRLQHLACRIHYMFPNPDTDGSEPVELTGPLHMVMTTTRKELEALCADIPTEIRTSCKWPPWPHDG